MHVLTIPATEMWNETTCEFVNIPETTIRIEHSLVSISKWEEKWHKAFLGKKEKTNEEIVDYIRCMTLTQNVNPVVYEAMPQSVIDEAIAYMEDSHSATTLMEQKGGKKNKDTPTSELIYYWMIESEIPFTCEKWHLNRLLNLIKICGVKRAASSGKKTRSSEEIAKDYARINAANKAKFKTRG